MGRTRGFGGLLTAVIVLLAGCVIVLLSPTPAQACECRPITRADAVEKADVIMFGTVRSVRPISDPSSGYELTLMIRYVYKGTAYTEQLIQTPDQGACGFAPRPGTSMVIFAKERAQPSTEHGYELVSTQCDGNIVTETPPRDVGRRYQPLPGSSADVGAAERMDEAIAQVMLTVVLVGVGIVIIGGAALVWLWRPGRTPN